MNFHLAPSTPNRSTHSGMAETSMESSATTLNTSSPIRPAAKLDAHGQDEGIGDAFCLDTHLVDVTLLDALEGTASSPLPAQLTNSDSEDSPLSLFTVTPPSTISSKDMPFVAAFQPSAAGFANAQTFQAALPAQLASWQTHAQQAPQSLNQQTAAANDVSPFSLVSMAKTITHLPAEISAIPTEMASTKSAPPIFISSALTATQPINMDAVTSTSTSPQNPTIQGEWASVRVDTSQAKWGEQMLQVLQDRVTLQAQQNMQEARIRLDPPELGKLDLLIRVEGDKLSVQITANAVTTRDALMQVSDRLRDELQQQNFLHVDVNVSSERDGQSRHGQHEASHDTILAENTIHQPEQVASSQSEHWLHLTV